MDRYSRNIKVIGSEGQRRLSEANVFVIGCGALGGEVAMLLTGAGIGHIAIADYDTIDISNLQRQLFFTEKEAGSPKAEILAGRMRELNSDIEVTCIRECISRKNAATLLKGYDFIIDATDNPATKYMIDDICLQLGLPACIGGVTGWRGQVISVRGGSEENPDSLRFRDFFPRPDEEAHVLPCMIEGVLGPVAALIASVQASEAIKYFTGKGKMLFDRVFSINLENMDSTILKF